MTWRRRKLCICSTLSFFLIIGPCQRPSKSIYISFFVEFQSWHVATTIFGSIKFIFTCSQLQLKHFNGRRRLKTFLNHFTSFKKILFSNWLHIKISTFCIIIIILIAHSPLTRILMIAVYWNGKETLALVGS